MNHPQPDHRASSNRVIKWVLAALALILLYFFVTRFLPRWWANRVVAIVDARVTVGWLFGIFIGFLFTLAPLLVVWFGVRSRSQRRTWRGWLGWVLAAIVAAAPNLMTLGIVIGVSNAARDAGQKLNTSGDGFRSGTVLGVALALAGALFTVYLIRSRRSARSQNRQLRAEVRAPERDIARDGRQHNGDAADGQG